MIGPVGTMQKRRAVPITLTLAASQLDLSHFAGEVFHHT
jgi:hypothetical protein